jgi:hypothetical protein
MKGTIGCLGFLYLMTGVFVALAWFGVPIGDGNHGLNVLFSRDLVITKGRVVSFKDMSTSSHPGCAPIVEIANGKSPSRFQGGGAATRQFDVGDEVPVAYPAGHPERAYIRTIRQMYFLPGLMLLFALPFFALAVWGTITNLPKRKG